MLKTLAAVLLLLATSGVAGGRSLFESMVRSGSEGQEQALDLGLYQEEKVPEGRKSLPKAVFLSLVLPGAGQYYLDAKREARAFFAVEAVAWSAYLGLNWYGRRVKDDYKVYAVSRAGASPKTHSEEYYYAIEVYRTNDIYNEEVRREARGLYPGDLEAQREYVLEHGYWGEDGWAWGDDRAWGEYGEMRTSSRDCFHKASYCVGAALLNRMVSAILAAKVTKDRNRELEGGSQFNLQFEPNMEGTGIKVVLSYTY